MKKAFQIILLSMILLITSSLVACAEPGDNKSGSAEAAPVETSDSVTESKSDDTSESVTESDDGSSEPVTELEVEDEVEIELDDSEGVGGL